MSRWRHIRTEVELQGVIARAAEDIDSSLQAEAKHGIQFTASFIGDTKDTGIADAHKPLGGQECLEELGTDGACKVRPALAPVEASACQRTSRHLYRAKVDTDSCEAPNTARRHQVSLSFWQEPSFTLQRLRDLHPEAAGEVVVARPRVPKHRCVA
jgi:hypothetical protein